MYWLFINASTGDAQAQPLSIDTLRRLATSIEGPAPSEVRYESIAYREVRSNLLVAGTGLREMKFFVRAYQLVVPGKRPILVDAGIAPGRQGTREFRGFDREAQNHVNRALESASQVVLLGEAPWHTGALSQRSVESAVWPGESPRAIAPGVVSIPANGLSGRPQMLYVRLENGGELLFTGAAAMTDQAWREVRPPARYRPEFSGGNDREVIASWLMTINALHKQAPDMTVVPGQQPGDLREFDQLLKGFKSPGQGRSQNAGQATGHKPRDNVLARRKS